jgi:prepilin signal peptidase PulO-like enzyme (type II secretory pathway)
MEFVYYLLPFIFGIIIGSFLNVVALRHKTGLTIKGRSMCMTCGNTLTWKELIPLLSFIIQGGSCRKCKSKISWQYPLIEFFAGIIFTLIFFYFPPLSIETATVTFLQIIIACLLLIITIYDFKHKIIPDSWVYAFAVLALVSNIIGGTSLWHIPTFWQLISGPLLAVPFAFIWLVSRGKWIGFGDVKLTLGIGWLLGISAGVNALIVSVWLAAFFGISIIIINLINGIKYKAGTEIPFGPYLILGMYLVLFFNIQPVDIDMIISVLRFYLL